MNNKRPEDKKRDIIRMYRNTLNELARTGSFKIAKTVAGYYEDEVGSDFWIRKYKVLHRKALR